MDFSALSPAALLISIMVAATPLLFAAIGELVVERSGVLNLGVEGMMIFGAIAGFATAVETGSPVLGIAGGAIGGALLSLVFGVLTQFFLTNQVATGLGLTMFGLGISALIGQPYSGVKPPSFPSIDIALSSSKSITLDPMIFVAFLTVASVALFLARARGGLVLRAVGENHDAAHSLGYNVIAVRLMAISFGGACAGVGGAYLSLIRVPQWTEGMTAGAGWIALAIVVFASWRPWRTVLGAYLFGGVTILQLNIQALGNDPYLTLGVILFVCAVLVLEICGLMFLRALPHKNLFRIVLGVWISSTLMIAFFGSDYNANGTLILGAIRLMLFVVLVVAGLLFMRQYETKVPLIVLASLITLAIICTLVGNFTDLSLQSQYLSMTPYIVTIIVLVIISADNVKASLNAPASLGRVFHKSG